MKPTREFFNLSKLGKNIYLNPFTIEDDEWRLERWTLQEQTEALKTLDMKIVLPLVWRSIDDDGKRAISSAKIVIWDGLKESNKDFESPEEKLKYVISGQKEIYSMWKALIQTMRNSVPDELISEKKSLKEEESSQTQRPMTSSHQNMDSTNHNIENSRADG